MKKERNMKHLFQEIFLKWRIIYFGYLNCTILDFRKKNIHRKKKFHSKNLNNFVTFRWKLDIVASFCVVLPALHSQPVERGYTVVPIDLNAPELNIPMGKKKATFESLSLHQYICITDGYDSYFRNNPTVQHRIYSHSDSKEFDNGWDFNIFNDLICR